MKYEPCLNPDCKACRYWESIRPKVEARIKEKSRSGPRETSAGGRPVDPRP